MPGGKKCPSCRKDWHYNDVVDNHSCCFSCRGLLAECSPSRPCGVLGVGSFQMARICRQREQKSPKNPRGIRILDLFSDFLSPTGLPVMPTLISKPAFDNKNAKKHTMFSGVASEACSTLSTSTRPKQVDQP